MVSERRDCRERKCTTYRQERNVGQSEGWYQREGTVGRGSVRPIDKRGMLDRVRDGIREKGLSGEEVYDLSTNIPHIKVGIILYILPYAGQQM